MADGRKAGREKVLSEAVGQGPACLRLRRYLKKHRTALPPVLRFSLILSAACAAGMLVTVVFGFILETHIGITLLEYIGLQTVAGPQSATLFVFTAAHPHLHFAWVIAMSTLNMAATLFLIVPLAYRGFERLRDNRVVGGLLRSTERYSVLHRKFLAHWGLLGLVLVTLAPVQGGGVLGAGILGVILRIPPRRLLITVFTAGALLNLAWTFVILFSAQAMPSGGLYDLVPYAVVAALLAAGAFASWRSHQRRYRFEVETIPGTPPAQVAKLAKVGIYEEDLVLRADLRKVCSHLGIGDKELPRARNTAELLRLDNLPPKAGERLTAAGVVSIRDLLAVTPTLVRDALAELEEPGFKAPTLAEVKAWQKEAARWEAAFHRQLDEHADPSATT